MLEAFIEGGYMNMETAQKYDQRPFRSMLMRGWVAYKPGRGFVVTVEGKDAWYEFSHTSIQRKNPSLPLTAYFDPTAYGLKTPAKRVHVMRPRIASAAS
jgi:hypothetical protein